MPPQRIEFPDGRAFAFTIIDDTEDASVENLTPVYDLFESCGMRTTKTVWPFRWTGGWSAFRLGATLDDDDYRAFVLDLARRGFEIASHGATMESSERERTLAGLERHRELFGAYPRIHANHGQNRENMYWGTQRIDNPLLRRAFRWWHKLPVDYFQGHLPDTPYWWGDACREHHDYVRNLTFNNLNVLRANPSMPYHDPSRPYVRWWFSAADAEGGPAFAARCTRDRLDRLEAEGGVCIMATHLGKGFAPHGVLHPGFRTVCEDLARRPGWYVPVGTLLDFLRERRGGDTTLPPREWRRMQWAWARDLLLRRIRPV